MACCAVKWAAVWQPCSSTSVLLQHLRVSEGLAEQSAYSSLIVFDSPVWQLMSRTMGGARESEGDGGGSSRTYCGSAVPLGCGSAKDRLRILAVTQQPHNSGLALIDFTPPVLWSDRVLCALAGLLDLQASAASLKPRIWFQTWLMHQNQTHDQCFTTAFNQRLWLQVKLARC